MNVLPDGTPAPPGADDHTVFTPFEWNSGLRNVQRLVDALWTEKPSIMVSEYAGRKRSMPADSPFPGLWSNDKTPYLREVMDNMSARSPVQRQVIAKGAQLGFTAAAENVIAYWMDVLPTAIMYVSATDDLLKIWSETRLEPLIDSCGLREKIFHQSTDKKNKRSGDKTLFKQFVGGNLAMVSAQSPGKLRSQSIRLLVRDEIDGAPSQLRTGEGNWLQVSFARTAAYGRRRKVLDFSTPTTIDESIVWPEYEAGDQRKFAVPCPYCGEYQFLVWESADENGPGIKWELVDGRIGEVWYQCEACGERIRNQHKTEMLARGEWRPTSTSSSAVLRSYHMSAIYSPVGMLSWSDIVAEYLKASESPDGMRSFVNLYLGEPFKETGTRPKLERLLTLRTGYKRGTIPSAAPGGAPDNGVLFLTSAVDVQRGSVKPNPDNPPRLEVEVCAHGAGYRSWSIDYFVFKGAIDDPYSGAWELFNRHVENGGFQFRRKDGVVFSPLLTLIDSGDVESTAAAYAFATGWNNCWPCKGSRTLKQQANEKADEATDANFKRYRVSKAKGGAELVVISTNYYKHLIYKSLEVPYQHTGIQRPGFCAFPRDYPDDYFDMLRAEERRRDGSFYKPSGRKNEALDLRVYNLAARDFYIDTKIEEIRRYYRDQGYTIAQVQAIRSKVALEWIAAAVARRKPAPPEVVNARQPVQTKKAG